MQSHIFWHLSTHCLWLEAPLMCLYLLTRWARCLAHTCTEAPLMFPLDDCGVIVLSWGFCSCAWVESCHSFLLSPRLRELASNYRQWRKMVLKLETSVALFQNLILLLLDLSSQRTRLKTQQLHKALGSSSNPCVEHPATNPRKMPMKCRRPNSPWRFSWL